MCRSGWQWRDAACLHELPQYVPQLNVLSDVLLSSSGGTFCKLFLLIRIYPNPLIISRCPLNQPLLAHLSREVGAVIKDKGAGLTIIMRSCRHHMNTPRCILVWGQSPPTSLKPQLERWVLVTSSSHTMTTRDLVQATTNSSSSKALEPNNNSSTCSTCKL